MGLFSFMVTDNASYTISPYLQLVVSYVYSDVNIFHIGLMQNNDFQTVLPRSERDKDAGLLLASFSGISPPTSYHPRHFFFNLFHILDFQVKVLLEKGFHLLI